MDWLQQEVCTRCTFINSPGSTSCTICHARLSDDSKALVLYEVKEKEKEEKEKEHTTGLEALMQLPGICDTLAKFGITDSDVKSESEEQRNIKRLKNPEDEEIKPPRLLRAEAPVFTSKGWTCFRCTFANLYMTETCLMCHCLRPHGIMAGEEETTISSQFSTGATTTATTTQTPSSAVPEIPVCGPLNGRWRCKQCHISYTAELGDLDTCPACGARRFCRWHCTGCAGPNYRRDPPDSVRLYREAPVHLISVFADGCMDFKVLTKPQHPPDKQDGFLKALLSWPDDPWSEDFLDPRFWLTPDTSTLAVHSFLTMFALTPTLYRIGGGESKKGTVCAIVRRGFREWPAFFSALDICDQCGLVNFFGENLKRQEKEKEKGKPIEKISAVDYCLYQLHLVQQQFHLPLDDLLFRGIVQRRNPLNVLIWSLSHPIMPNDFFLNSLTLLKPKEMHELLTAALALYKDERETETETETKAEASEDQKNKLIFFDVLSLPSKIRCMLLREKVDFTTEPFCHFPEFAMDFASQLKQIDAWVDRKAIFVVAAIWRRLGIKQKWNARMWRSLQSILSFLFPPLDISSVIRTRHRPQHPPQTQTLSSTLTKFNLKIKQMKIKNKKRRRMRRCDD